MHYKIAKTHSQPSIRLDTVELMFLASFVFSTVSLNGKDAFLSSLEDLGYVPVSRRNGYRIDFEDSEEPMLCLTQAELFLDQCSKDTLLKNCFFEILDRKCIMITTSIEDDRMSRKIYFKQSMVEAAASLGVSIDIELCRTCD